MVFDEDMTETEFHIVVEWLLSLFFSFPFKPCSSYCCLTDYSKTYFIMHTELPVRDSDRTHQVDVCSTMPGISAVKT